MSRPSRLKRPAVRLRFMRRRLLRSLARRRAQPHRLLHPSDHAILAPVGARTRPATQAPLLDLIQQAAKISAPGLTRGQNSCCLFSTVGRSRCRTCALGTIGAFTCVRSQTAAVIAVFSVLLGES